MNKPKKTKPKKGKSKKPKMDGFLKYIMFKERNRIGYEFENH